MGTVYPDLEMQVRTVGVAGAAYRKHRIAFFDLLPNTDLDS